MANKSVQHTNRIVSLCCLKILQCKTQNFSGLEFMHPLNYALMCTVQCPPLFIFDAELTLKSLSCAWAQYTQCQGGWDPIDSHICSLQYNGTHYPMQTSQHHHRRIAQIKRHHRYHTQIQIKRISARRRLNIIITVFLHYCIQTLQHLHHIHTKDIINNISSLHVNFFASSLSRTHNIAAIHSLIAQNLLLCSKVDV